ncbi:RNA-binding S4 domain-containing protein [Phenylobacterium sp.]|jgi:ribosome-associated heat shock protein Hsp15|uniref:RNA-binding S4 domain-containing protein n=1 Tax=Phenylobacterium sp. TaxID=1871053 RepID=UPI0037C93A1F
MVDSARTDVWLWRARFFKTRSAAATFIDSGRVRLTRHGQETRLDKPSRTVRVGDQLMFAIAGRLIDVEVVSLGERRGPPSEAQKLYSDRLPL